MSSAAESKNPESIATQVQAARRAARELARLSADQRNQILLTAADALEAHEEEILKANREDCELTRARNRHRDCFRRAAEATQDVIRRHQGHGKAGSRRCQAGRPAGPRACHHGTR